MTRNERDTPEPEAWLTDGEESALAGALCAAYAPAPLDPARHAELLAAALEDPLAPPTEDELRASERLRQALEGGDTAHPDAALARALAAAHRSAALEPEREVRTRQALLGRPANVVFVAFGATALAAAAALALFLARPAQPPRAPGSLALSRTTAELFHEPFDSAQASARIDRIAEYREREGRDNRYALWGVSR
jgi:hypothetical protein